MPAPRALLFDVGGVCLTNGWDHDGRRAAAEHFSLDYDRLARRHDALYAEFERGEVGLDAYLTQAVFYTDRPFSREEFVEFMRSRSRPHPDMLALVERLRDGGDHLLATLNNESREINEYRIRRFGLDRLFEAFFSSCYLGVRKPSERIFRITLGILGIEPEEAVFVGRPRGEPGGRPHGRPPRRPVAGRRLGGAGPARGRSGRAGSGALSEEGDRR